MRVANFFIPLAALSLAACSTTSVEIERSPDGELQEIVVRDTKQRAHVELDVDLQAGTARYRASEISGQASEILAEIGEIAPDVLERALDRLGVGR